MASEELYHERQRLQLCLIHTVNNILQRKEFDAAKMDEICYSFNESRWFNPHRSWVGTGNYDVNILMAALQMHDLKVIWFDKRLPTSSIHVEKVKALVFNVPSKTLLTLYRGTHWFAVLKKNDKFWNLDSKIKTPEAIVDIQKFLESHVASGDTEVMLVVEKDVDEEKVVEKRE
uniref:ubiquitinyl hydrolase 1 n=1 Tax=Caenorhabditis japonica TaxID=281687 RepID=A0A8R1I558_CAEJA